ncbi:hypothetical protein VPH35_071496 [Triticum aestivum]
MTTTPSPFLFLLDPLVCMSRQGDETADNHKNLLSAKEVPPPPLSTCIHAVDKNLILVITSFPKVYPRDIYLIYNAIDRSLHMIPSPPSSPPRATVLTARLLVARRRDDDACYALAFPGSIRGVGSKRDPVLFVSPSSSDSQWEIAKRAEGVSHRGRGYWVDLLLGGMYCDCADLLSDEHSVDVRSLDLPVGCERYLGDRDDIPHPRAFRTVGCVGDSIKFVSITGFLEHVDLADDRIVRVWRLKEDMSWDLDYELKFGSLREDGAFKGNHLATSMAPMYPFLSMQEDRVIYFALGEYMYQDPEFCFPSTPSFWLHTSLTDASIGCLLAISGNAEGKLAWTSSQEEEVANF